MKGGEGRDFRRVVVEGHVYSGARGAREDTD